MVSNHTYTKKIGGDSIDLFLVFQVERETVMTLPNNKSRCSKSQTSDLDSFNTLSSQVLEVSLQRGQLLLVVKLPSSLCKGRNPFLYLLYHSHLEAPKDVLFLVRVSGVSEMGSSRFFFVAMGAGNVFRRFLCLLFFWSKKNKNKKMDSLLTVIKSS